MDVTVHPREAWRVDLTVPGDKSISHRAALLGALAEGDTDIRGYLMGADCLSTLACLRSLGVGVDVPEPGHVTLHGLGLNGLREPEDVLDAGNSGTTLRLLAGVLAGRPFTVTVTGDASLRRRPMLRVVEPLRAMGAAITGREGGRLAPLTFHGGSLAPRQVTLPVASAQVKSALLLAGLRTEGVTSVTEPSPSRDHTERMLRAFGAEVEVTGTRVSVRGGAVRLVGQGVVVPGDISSAAFLLAAAAATPGAEALVRGVGLNPTRTGVIDALRAMGADIAVVRQEEICGEPVGDLLVRGGSLHGTVLEGDLIPRAIDELPVLAVAACLAEGPTTIRDAAELRVKESDRIAALAAELRHLGAVVEERPDGMVIPGRAALPGGRFTGGRVESRGDHRLAMSLAVAGLLASAPVTIGGAECVDVSYPGFFEQLAGLSRSSSRTENRR